MSAWSLLAATAAAFNAPPLLRGSRASSIAMVESSSSALLDRSLLAAHACSLAFLPPVAVASSPYAQTIQFVDQFEDPRSLSGATLLSSNGEVILACRGSANAKNFQTNFNVGPAALESASGSVVSDDARVHAGFQRAAQQLWKRIEPRIPVGTTKLLMTGHSLGGGTATLLALYAEAAGFEPELVTVAGPRLGSVSRGYVPRTVQHSASMRCI